MRLNLGCGPLRIDGEIGVDRYLVKGLDVRADVRALPFQAASIAFARLDHVLEHLPGRQVVPILGEVYRVLRPGGRIKVGAPDLRGLCRAYADAVSLGDRALLLRWLYGSQAHAGEYHASGWDQETLGDVLRCVGFVDVVARDEERDEGICMAAEGTKP